MFDEDTLCRPYLLIPRLPPLPDADANRLNFAVDRSTGQAKTIDFEHAEPYDEEKAQLELRELRAELSKTTGRGAAGSSDSQWRGADRFSACPLTPGRAEVENRYL